MRVLRDSSSGLCVGRSPRRVSLEIGGPAAVSGTVAGAPTTDGQPCGEQLTHKPLAEPLRQHCFKCCCLAAMSAIVSRRPMASGIGLRARAHAWDWPRARSAPRLHQPASRSSNRSPASHPHTLRLPQHSCTTASAPCPLSTPLLSLCCMRSPRSTPRRTARRPTSALTLTISPCAHSNEHAQTRPCT